MTTPGGIDPQRRRAGLRRVWLATLAALLTIVAIGIVFMVEGNRAAGVFLLVLGPLLSGLFVAVLWGSHRPFGPDRFELEATGRVLPRVPPGGAVWSAKRQAWRWTGGGNVPLELGRLNAAMPMAKLELAANGLTLSFRLGFLVLRETSWRPADVVGIYPVRGRWLGFNRGIAVEPPEHRVSYFWTFRPGQVLAALEQAGFPVSWSERYIGFLS